MRILFTVLALSTSLVLNAQTASKATHKAVPKAAETKDSPLLWPNEPTSFLGIKLDQPLTDSFAECTEVELSARYKGEALKAPCWENLGSFKVLVGIWPFEHAFVHEYDGKVGEIVASFHELQRNEIQTALLDKYGKPQGNFTETKQNGYGAQFANQQQMWLGSKLSLFFNPIGVSEDEGNVTVDTHEYARYSEAKRKQAAEGVKGIL